MTGPDESNIPPPVGRSLAGGVLMGLANLVPGISGGTMILAVGLYDRFVGAVADLTRMKWRRESIVFLGLVGVGMVGAVLAFSGVAVSLVTEQRWIMYSLFIGLTLGGVPELVKEARWKEPGAGRVWLAIVLGMVTMAWLTFSMTGAQLPDSVPVLMVVGAVAASSMILPGISGSYILLILGMYDTVLGSLSVGALREDWASCARVVAPFVFGAAAGVALLSNALKWLLSRYSRVSHGALLGLLCGSVLGLFPFQTPSDPALAQKSVRKATSAVLAGEPAASAVATFDLTLTVSELEALAERHRGRSPGDLKARGEALETYKPGTSQVFKALALCFLGVILTRLLGRGGVQSGSKDHD